MADGNKGDNGGGKLAIGDLFETADLMMLIETLNFAATRSRFSSGPGNEEVSRRFHFLSEKLLALSPLPKGERSLGFEWFKAMKKAAACRFYGAYLVEEDQGYRETHCHLDVVCDDEVHRVVTKGRKEEIVSSLPEVLRFVREAAPIDAEPLVGLNGMVDLGERVEIRRRGNQGWENKGRLDGVSRAMEKALSPATPFVHVVDASNFWGIKTVVEARFAVPVSVAPSVIAHVSDINADALAEYSKKYSSPDFAVSLAP